MNQKKLQQEKKPERLINLTLLNNVMDDVTQVFQKYHLSPAESLFVIRTVEESMRLMNNTIRETIMDNVLGDVESIIEKQQNPLGKRNHYVG